MTLFGRINPDGDAVLDFGNDGTVIVLVDVPTLDGQAVTGRRAGAFGPAVWPDLLSPFAAP